MDEMIAGWTDRHGENYIPSPSAGDNKAGNKN